MDQPEDAASQNEQPAYAFKSSLLGAPWEFRLGADRLLWAVGRRQGSVPYTDIRRLRLSYRPATMQSYRFTAEIWSTQAPKLTIASTSWRGLVEQERLDRPYRDFVLALHARIRAAGGNPVLEAGANPLLYWPGLLVFAGIAVAVLALAWRAVQESFLTALLFLAAALGLLFWQVGGIFRRNWPRRYTLAEIPDLVLPKSKTGG
jgi:hypothetical protein